MSYLLRYPDKVLNATLEHLALTLTALAISLLIAVPLGVLLARRPRLYGPSIAGLSVLYTIPSISLLALLIPVIGLGFWPTVLALVIYCQAILVRNVVAGIRGVDAAVIESARGMGLSDRQRLFKVELPLALPVILAGVRIAAVSTISIATVAAYFDAGGLGALIREGISQDYGAKIMAGVIAVAALAIITEQLLRVLTRRSERHRAAVAPGS
jgi:osmoprotectant transport system permease protein